MKIMEKPKEKTYFYKIIKSPVGDLKLVVSKDGLTGILWHDGKTNPPSLRYGETKEDKKNKILIQAEKQLSEYFTGKRKKFAIKADFVGTDFQKKVWKALLDIPYGQTVTYGDIARKIGK